MDPYFERDGIAIYNGDCREVLRQLAPASVDLLLTDPPYGQRYTGRYGQHAIAGDGLDEALPLLEAALEATSPLLRDDAHLLVFTGADRWAEFRQACSAIARPRGTLIWHKDRGGMGDTRCTYALDYEVIIYSGRKRRPIVGRRDGAVLQGYPPPPARRRAHPTEKPVALLERFIERHCPPDGLALDPFMGAGSTLLAAQAAGRRAIGIELDAKYCEVAAERLGAAYGAL